MSKKQVFLSHSNHDVVLTRLIGHLLESEGVACFYSERDIPVGGKFDETIVKRIHSSNVFLVVWTAQAAASTWVNQEIGIALAKNIPVWPLVIDDTTITGAMFRQEGSLLSHDASPHAALRELATAIKKSAQKEPFEPHVDQFIIGKEARTQRLIELLRTETAQNRTPYTLRIQAAFSTFAVSASRLYRVGGYHTEEYHRLLVQERQEIELMLKRAKLRMIIWPQRPYEDAFMLVRFRNLLAFLHDHTDYDRVRVVMGPYHGENRYMLDGNVLITGIKSPGVTRPGYELTTIAYHGPTIAAAIDDFERQFSAFWAQHAQACNARRSDAAAIRAHVIKELSGIAPGGAQHPKPRTPQGSRREKR